MIVLADLSSIAGAPDFDAFTGGFALMIGASIITAGTVGLINFVRRIVS